MATSQTSAKQRQRARQNAWRAAHRDQIHAQDKIYRAAHRDEKRAYDAAHRDKLKAYIKAYALARRVQLRAYHRAWDIAHRDELIAYRQAHHVKRRAEFRKWVRANPGRWNALMAKRRAAEFNATPSWADHASITAVYAESARRTRETGIEHHVDHYYPLQGETVCGLHVEHNLRVITKSENSRKKNHYPSSAL